MRRAIFYITIGSIGFLNTKPIYAIEYYALLVRIEDYQSIFDLNYCVDDVMDMQETLLDFPNCEYWNSSRITMITNSQATKSKIRAKFR